MSTWLTILVIGVATFALRAALVLVVGRTGAVPRLERITSHVMPAAFAALAASALAGGADAGGLGAALPGIAAVTVGFVVARRTGSVGAALAAGMPVAWLLVLVVPGA